MQFYSLQRSLARYGSLDKSVSLPVFIWRLNKHGSSVSKFEKLQKKYYFMTGKSNMNFQL